MVCFLPESNRGGERAQRAGFRARTILRKRSFFDRKRYLAQQTGVNTDSRSRDKAQSTVIRTKRGTGWVWPISVGLRGEFLVEFAGVKLCRRLYPSVCTLHSSFAPHVIYIVPGTSINTRPVFMENMETENVSPIKVCQYLGPIFSRQARARSML